MEYTQLFPLLAVATGDVMGQNLVVILTAFFLLGAGLIAYFVWIARKGGRK